MSASLCIFTVRRLNKISMDTRKIRSTPTPTASSGADRYSPPVKKSTIRNTSIITYPNCVFLYFISFPLIEQIWFALFHIGFKFKISLHGTQFAFNNPVNFFGSGQKIEKRANLNIHCSIEQCSEILKSCSDLI